MKSISAILGGIALLCVLTNVSAQTTLTRDQVRKQYEVALASGLVPVGDLGTIPAEAHPERYPVEPPRVSTSRADVLAELSDAIAQGAMPFGEIGRSPRDLTPSRYPVAQDGPGLTRQQVRDELARARTQGLLQHDERGLTQAEMSPRRYPEKPRDTAIRLKVTAVMTSERPAR